MPSNKTIVAVALLAAVAGAAASLYFEPTLALRLAGTEPGQRVLGAVLEAKAPKPPAGTKIAERGDIVPTMTLSTLDGTKVEIPQAWAGSPTLVNLWASWCGPCLKEMPELSALDAMREHIVVVGLAYEDNTPEVMREFMKEHPVVYPIALLDVYNPPKDFEPPRGLPMTYLITPEGKVARKYAGPVTARMLEEGIAEAGGPAQG